MLLTDQFGGHNVIAQTIERFCDPATVGTPPTGAPPVTESWVHMTWYRITADLRSYGKVKVLISNQLGANQRMTVETPPRFVMIPTQKIAKDGNATGLGDPAGTDYFTCYQASGTGGSLRAIIDEFGTESKKLGKLVHLCGPSNKVFGESVTPATRLSGPHLVCYTAASYRKAEHTVSVKDQFSSVLVKLRQTSYTCLSSTKTLA